MVKLGTYAAASTIGAVAVVFHAFQSRGQFYPAMLYLATSKISLVLLSNMALVLMCAIWQSIKFIFLGTLREAEVERLNEQSWRELMEILFAMTIFREEFNIPFVAMVTVLLFIKAFHWLAQKRVEYIETTPSVSRLSHFRMISFLALLLLLDSAFLHNSVSFLLRTKEPSVSLLFAFEYMILATSTIAIFLKYVFYVCDMVLEGQWENKAVYTFYLELVRDLVHLSLYLLFFLVIFINYGLPLHLVRELYETFRNFKARVADFIRYRKITSNMNDRFPDATAEELGRSDATCIICREEMVAAKKLPCGHLFHVHCLRSWLERQQTCPTCRSPVLAPEGGQAGPGGDRAAAPLQPQQEQQHQPPLPQIPQLLQGQGGLPNVQTTNTPQNGEVQGAATGGVFNVSEARLQAAAAAASQYNSSFVYPAINGSDSVRYPMYLYLVPHAYLAGVHGAQNLDVGGTSSSAEGGNRSAPMWQSNMGSFASWQGPCILPCAFFPGMLPSHGSFPQGLAGLHANGSLGNSFASSQGGSEQATREHDNQQNFGASSNNVVAQGFLELQQRQLQESIAVLEHRLRRIVDIQNTLHNSSNPSSSKGPYMGKEGTAPDMNGKAPVDADKKGKAPASEDGKES